MAARPALNLPRRHEQLFVSHVSRLAVAAPIKSFEGRARLFVRSWVPKRTDPRGNHGPIVVETGLALPAMQLGIGDALARNIAHCLQSGTPIRAAYVHQYAVHVENQDLRLELFLHSVSTFTWRCGFPRQRRRNARGRRRKM